MRFLVVLVVVGLGCGTTDESGPLPARGTERGRCQPGGGCGEGLVCLSDRCVRPPPEVTRSQVGVGPGSATAAPLSGVCEAYVQTLERFARCSKLPADSARALRQSITQLRTMYAQYGTVPSAIQSCQMANDATKKAMLQVGC